MEMIYKFRDGSRLKGDADAVGHKLHEIHAKRGKLTAPDVVEEARPPKSVLHQYFEWDNKNAAEQWRIEQARHLVASIVTVETDGDEVRPVRSFVSLNNSYEPIEVVLSDVAMRQQAINEVQAAIRSLKDKIIAFEEFSDVIVALDRVEEVASRHFVRTARKAGEKRHSAVR